MKLVIGAGTRHIDGFTHHDIQPLEGIDICCDYWDLPNHVEQGSCEEIQITHVLEHFPMAKTLDAVKLLFRLLKKGGKIYIEVPNFYWQCLMIVRNPLDRQVVEYAYGGQHNEWDFHYNGFTPQILREDLTSVGFVIDKLEPNSSIECWARKQ